MKSLLKDSRGTQLVLPFLLFAAMFLALYGVYYFFYSSSMNRMAKDMEVIELQTEATRATGQSVWANENIVYGDEVRIPINDLKALRDEWGDNESAYLRCVPIFFVWRETMSLFEITIDHDTEYHTKDNQLTINITAYSDNETTAHGANWMNFEAPGYIHVGKTWFTTYGIRARDLSGSLWGILTDKLGVTPQIKTGWPANVEIYVSKITPSASSSGDEDIIWGEVTLSWGTYAGSIGEIGWIRSLGDLMTVNLPGVPTVIRMVLAVPLLLCVGYITALFIKQIFFSL